MSQQNNGREKEKKKKGRGEGASVCTLERADILAFANRTEERRKEGKERSPRTKYARSKISPKPPT